jgi:hypothetical protein
MTRSSRGRFIALTALALLPAWAVVSRGQQTREPPLAPTSTAQTPPAPKLAVDPRAQLTETVGLLSGLYLYQSYLTMGLLADGKTERLYDEKAARGVLASVLGPLETVDKHLGRVVELTQTPGDRQAAERLRVTVGLLRRQGQELIAFWDSGQPAAGARYEATRQEAWRQLTALLALDKGEPRRQ